jgi:hypothetical protein
LPLGAHPVTGIEINEQLIEGRSDGFSESRHAFLTDHGTDVLRPTARHENWLKIKRVADFGKQRKPIASPARAHEISLKFGYPGTVASESLRKRGLAELAALAPSAQLLSEHQKYVIAHA